MEMLKALMMGMGLCAMAGACGGLPAAERPPNLVVVFIDDMGYGDIGPFGSTLNRTPNLDRMAAEGMKLTSFYAAPVCSVSRAQLLTGCYGARISVPGVYGPGSKNGLNPNENTIAELVKPAGYATMCIGKWHCGDQPEFLPTRQGFDHYFGIPYSNDMLRKSLETGESVVPLLRDEKVVELLTDTQQTTVTERYTEEAVKFIRENRERPFFLYFPHTAVHTPIEPGAKFAGRSANGRFGDWVEEVDWSVGQVLETLRELELAEDTLVIFTSDNGPWLIKGSDGGVATPLRGGKGSTWEGGVREPTLAWWPGKIAPGSVCDTVAGTIDLLPTLVGLSGGTVPDEPVIDGRDIAPLLLGKTTQAAREAHFYFRNYTLEAVRQGPWKLAVVAQPESMGMKLAGGAEGKSPRLYNLDAEINEQTDVSAAHPDVVEKLTALLEAARAEIESARRPAGEVEDAVMLYPAEVKVKRPTGKRAVKPAALDVLKVGDSIPAEAAPQVGGRAFEIRCEVEPPSAEGVILSHGGKAVGYALYWKERSVVFVVRQGQKIARVPSRPIAEPVARIEAELKADGELRLTVNGEVVTGRCEGLLGRQPAEDFCVGFDDRITVDDYDGKARWKGEIRGLKVR
ncbi:MAG: sulfatase [Verrucomicrobiales bacterium]|nr:sulfatase [Verrucomicrobiales bacterium]